MVIKFGLPLENLRPSGRQSLSRKEMRKKREWLLRSKHRDLMACPSYTSQGEPSLVGLNPTSHLLFVVPCPPLFFYFQLHFVYGISRRCYRYSSIRVSTAKLLLSSQFQIPSNLNSFENINISFIFCQTQT